MAFIRTVYIVDRTKGNILEHKENKLLSNFRSTRLQAYQSGANASTCAAGSQPLGPLLAPSSTQHCNSAQSLPA